MQVRRCTHTNTSKQTKSLSRGYPRRSIHHHLVMFSCAPVQIAFAMLCRMQSRCSFGSCTTVLVAWTSVGLLLLITHWTFSTGFLALRSCVMLHKKVKQDRIRSLILTNDEKRPQQTKLKFCCLTSTENASLWKTMTTWQEKRIDTMIHSLFFQNGNHCQNTATNKHRIVGYGMGQKLEIKNSIMSTSD